MARSRRGPRVILNGGRCVPIAHVRLEHLSGQRVRFSIGVPPRFASNEGKTPSAVRPLLLRSLPCCLAGLSPPWDVCSCAAVAMTASGLSCATFGAQTSTLDGTVSSRSLSRARDAQRDHVRRNRHLHRPDPRRSRLDAGALARSRRRAAPRLDRLVIDGRHGDRRRASRPRCAARSASGPRRAFRFAFTYVGSPRDADIRVRWTEHLEQEDRIDHVAHRSLRISDARRHHARDAHGRRAAARRSRHAGDRAARSRTRARPESQPGRPATSWRRSFASTG